MSAPPLTPPRSPAPPAPPTPTPPPRDGLAPGRLALGLLLIVLGGAWLVEVLDIATVRWQTVLAGALIAVAGALLLSARRADNGGLIALGIILSVLLVLAAWTPRVPVTGGVGDRAITPQAIEELEADYELGAGNLVLDLRSLDLPPGPTEVRAHVGAGELRVRVPRGVAVEVEAASGAGELNILGERRNGLGLSLTTRDGSGDARLLLDVAVGLGTIEVTR
jgi:hypothetical protein